MIKLHIEADKRTVKKYMKMLNEDLEFLKTVRKNPYGVVIYRIDIPTVEQYLNEYMKDRLKQLTLLDVRLRRGEVKVRKV